MTNTTTATTATADLQAPGTGTFRYGAPPRMARISAPTARMATAHRADLSHLGPVAAIVVAFHRFAD